MSEHTPYDAAHPLIDDGSDWRHGNSLGDIGARAMSYGNWAGPGNRALIENPEYVKEQRAKNPRYDETQDPRFLNDPRYAPVDGFDAAAMHHDGGYARDLTSSSMFGWNGINQVAGDDKKLGQESRAELAKNGSKYSAGANAGVREAAGFFGGRADAVDGIHWGQEKLGEIGTGVSSFAHGASQWGSVGDAEHGIGTGLHDAGNWMSRTGSEAVSGIGTLRDHSSGLGARGIAGEVLGIGNVLGAGVGHAVARGASTVGSGVAHGASTIGGGVHSMWNHLVD